MLKKWIVAHKYVLSIDLCHEDGRLGTAGDCSLFRHSGTLPFKVLIPKEIMSSFLVKPSSFVLHTYLKCYLECSNNKNLDFVIVNIWLS